MRSNLLRILKLRRTLIATKFHFPMHGKLNSSDGSSGTFVLGRQPKKLISGTVQTEHSEGTPRKKAQYFCRAVDGPLSPTS